MRARRSSLLACLTAVAAAATSIQALVTSPSSATPAVPAAAPAAVAAPSAPQVSAPGDVALNAWGDGRGYHVAVATSEGGYAWVERAVLRPAGMDSSSWTGYQCLSGDGRYAAVAVLPLLSANRPQARDAGAFAYAVDLRTGRTRALVTGVGLKYHSPGCDAGHRAIFTSNPGQDQQSTRVVEVDLASGAVLEDETVSGQVTSVVPTAAGPVGVLGATVVRLEKSSDGVTAHRLAAAHGRVYELRSSGDGVAGLSLVPGAGTARVVRVGARGGITELGEGPAGDLHLFAGRKGRPVVVGAARLSAGAPLVSVRTTSAHPWGASQQGALLLADRTTGVAPQATSVHQAAAAAELSSPRLIDASSGKDVTARPATGHAAVTSAIALQAAPSRQTGRAKAVNGKAGSARAAAVVVPAAAQTPKCSVPRLAENRQVLQPWPAQIDWAVQMAEQGLLTGSSSTRPAGWGNLGLASYSPNSDFGKIALKHPASDTWDSVPRSVYEAISAQESNWSQASWHALPGIAGGPLISDYYGAAGTITTINYAAADCGYGVGQVTSGMATSETTFSANGKTKIAVDYQENIAAGLQILEKTWNQLYDGGVLANGGNPRYLENWFFAAWAYNTGIQPNAKNGNTTGCTPGPSCTGIHGTWGLGWTNNPANPDYPPTRLPYLKTTYADAAHPSSWPYEERILGWMGSPLIRLSQPAYAKPTYQGGQTWLQVPAWQTFCTSSNACDPTYVDATDPSLSHCTLSDRQCWWHDPVSWVASCSTTCATSSYAYGAGSTEPASGTSKHPPVCSLDTAKVPTTSSGAPIVVDESTSQPPLNRVGCGTPNWSQGGTFSYAAGTNANGDKIGEIDTHQLGAGFGGHALFTHTEDGKNADLVNTGTWTPTLPKLQYYTVKIHLPSTGASASDVVYKVYPGGGVSPWMIRVNQNWGTNEWATIGTFAMQNGGYVTLSNTSTDTAYGDSAYSNFDVAFDAVAFVQQGGTPGKPIGGPPRVVDAPKGSNPAWVQCGCVRRTAGDPVDTSTGYFGESWTDLSFGGRGLPVSFSRSYGSALASPTGPNAASAVNGPFGYGWTYSYGLSAVTDTATSGVTIKQEDGSQVQFTLSGTTYAPVLARNDATLVKSGTTYRYTRRSLVTYVFDVTTGRLTSITDLLGQRASTPYATALTYDTSGHLATVTDPAAHKLTVTWTGSHITKIQDSTGRIVSYGYDAAGNLSDVYGVGTTRSPSLLNDDRTQYTYTAAHLMATMRGPRGYGVTTTPLPVVGMVYDASERVTKQTDQLGRVTTFDYGPNTTLGLVAGQTLITDPAGHKRLDTYTDGLLTSQTRGYGTSLAGTWSYTYDPISLGIATAKDPKGSVQTYAYDERGNRTLESDARGYVTSHTYDGLGNVTSTVTPDGVRTRYAYDEAGHIAVSGGGTNTGSVRYGLLTSITTQALGQPAEVPDGNPPTATSRVSQFYYDDAAHPGDLARVVDPRGKTTTTTYDAAGNAVAVKDPLAHTTKYGFDARGWMTSAVSPRGVAAGIVPGCTPPAKGCTMVGHDAWGNVTTITDPLGKVSKVTYDAEGHRTSETDANSRTTTYVFDAAGQPTTVKRADGTQLVTHYNADATIKDTVDGAGLLTAYGYDSWGRQITRTDPKGRKITVAYDKAGHASTFTDPLNRVTTYGNDPAGHVTSIKHSDGTTPDVTSSYDAMGRRIKVVDGTGTRTWAYDDFGQVVSAVNGAGASVGYSYDAAGNLTGLLYPGATSRVLTRAFDDAGRLTAVKDWSARTILFGYDEDDDLTSTTFPNGTSVANTLSVRVS